MAKIKALVSDVNISHALGNTGDPFKEQVKSLVAAGNLLPSLLSLRKDMTLNLLLSQVAIVTAHHVTLQGGCS